MPRKTELYLKAWYSWRGKAAAWAKSGNKEKLKIGNDQKLRYFNKYADEVNMSNYERSEMARMYLI